MQSMKDYYSILGVTKSAMKMILKVHSESSRKKYHPDKKERRGEI